MNQNEKPLKQAENYFIINRCSFSGSTLSGGFSLESSKKRFTPSSIDRVEKLDLSNVEFSNEDFVDFFEKHMIGTPPAMVLTPKALAPEVKKIFFLSTHLIRVQIICTEKVEIYMRILTIKNYSNIIFM